MKKIFGLCLLALGALQAVPALAAEKVFRLANTRDPQSIDPAFLDARPENLFGRALFEGLVAYDPKQGSPVAGVAESWTVSPDGLKYTFKLRPTARWSNGKPVLASDFIYAWKRVMDPSTGAYFPKLFTNYIEGAQEYVKAKAKGSADFSKVGISSPDEKTIIIKLKKATPFYLEVVGMSSYYPLPKEVVEKNGKDWTKPDKIVGNGPYAIESMRMKDKTIFVKNKNYWDAMNVKIDRMIIFPIEDDKSALNMYRAGELDWIGAVPTSLLPTLKSNPELHTGALLGTRYIRVNTTKPQLANAKVRRAMALALDRKILVEKVLKEGQAPAFTFIPPGLTGYKNKAQISENAAEAKKLIAEAGYPGGKGFPETTLLFQNNAQSALLATAISKMLGDALGIKVSQLGLEKGMFYDKLDAMQHDLALSNFTADFNDAESFLAKFTSDNTSENLTGFKNASYDQLLKKAGSSANVAERSELLATAEKMLVLDEAAIVPLYHGTNLEMWKTYVSGLYMNPLGFHPLKDLSLNK